MNDTEHRRRSDAISALADAIAADNPNASSDATGAWAVQHINEVALHRNAFSGIDGITAEHAEAGLADYLTDHHQWSRRIYDAELQAGLRRCGRTTDKGMLPRGVIVHDVGNVKYTDDWVAHGYADAAWKLDECPERQSRKTGLPR